MGIVHTSKGIHMEISFPQNHSRVFEADVIEFPAVVDGERTSCRITIEELERDFSVRDLNTETFESEFLRLRSEIERHARDRLINNPR
jgi:Protein of unknown function (DUF1488)